MCVLYLSGGTGGRRKALDGGDAQTILVDDEPKDAYVFGSPTKPTYDETADVQRYVTPDGEIWATSPDGARVVFTGQTIDSLAQKWGINLHH